MSTTTYSSIPNSISIPRSMPKSIPKSMTKSMTVAQQTDLSSRRRQPLRTSPAVDVQGRSVGVDDVVGLLGGRRTGASTLRGGMGGAGGAVTGGVLVDPTGFVSDSSGGAISPQAGHHLAGPHVRQVFDPLVRPSTQPSPQRSLRPAVVVGHRGGGQGGRECRASNVNGLRGRRSSRHAIRSTAVGALLLALVGLVAASTDSASARPESPRQASTLHVVVQPGDSIWTIARRVQPRGDVRPLVQSIIELHGSASLDVGETIAVPVD